MWNDLFIFFLSGSKCKIYIKLYNLNMKPDKFSKQVAFAQYEYYLNSALTITYCQNSVFFFLSECKASINHARPFFY